jgi:hypothetical protein
VTEQVAGVAITAEPASFTLARGAQQVVTLTTSYDGGVLGEWAKGSLTFDGPAHDVRIPVAVRPVAVAAPTEVTETGATGSRTFSVTPGFTGTLTPGVTGLLGATPTAGIVTSGEFVPTMPAPGPAAKAFTLDVPAGGTLVRFDVDAVSDKDDLDLYVYDATNKLVALSASAAADEQVTLSSLPAGVYTAYVNGYDTGGGGGFSYTAWALPPGAVGNASVTPASQEVRLAEPVNLTLSWKGLTAGQRYLGFVSYVPGSAERTIVSIG